ncbi:MULTISPECIES: glutaredoxin family protein [Thiohalobacter]|uniref:Thiol-disulfide isomerase and thioredoxins n=1 Tax=Thiohalobacter thiocyanaticus TaxID=585455 RepID=A0A1Z4VPN4_9GAMM|nr:MULTISPECIES: glutaredoxin family protein [Thiohalobacter]BAZ93465.1 thiol-disulfide isomerase and thioredoxins [Thiohalobacter thiocyanaticus]
MTRLILYARPECGLCQDLEQELRVLQPDLGFELRVIDIDRDPALVERWGTRVPVLTTADDRLICEYFLDPAALRAICRPDECV